MNPPLARRFSSAPRTIRRENGSSHYVAFTLLVLVTFWFICFILLSVEWQHEITATTIRFARNNPSTLYDGKTMANPSFELGSGPQLLSRSGNVEATSDVRGNLGPASVVIQPKPGDDWLRDRWQAASDMHGTNIPGAHWIQLDLGSDVVVDSVVLDWETAYADMYRLEGSLYPVVGNENEASMTEDHRIEKGNVNTNVKVWILFDGTDPAQEVVRSVSKSGQSPGVKTKLPLHIVHKIHPISVKQPIRYLRLNILKSQTGWGVSLWQFDVYGFRCTNCLEQ